MRFGSELTLNRIDFQGDGALTVSGGGGAWPVLRVLAGGTMRKSGGNGAFVIDPGVVAAIVGASISVDSGTLELPGNSSVYVGGAAFSVAGGATLNLVPTNESASFSGTFR